MATGSKFKLLGQVLQHSKKGKMHYKIMEIMYGSEIS
jgi:hypothetical protein